MLRRHLMATVAGALLLAGLSGQAALAQEKKLTLLTWNLPIYEEKFRGWIADFEEMHPDFTVEWLDKKGTEFGAFYQTQLVAGTAPDIIDVQGMLWAEYAANDGLVPLDPYLEANPEVRDRYNAEGMKLWQYDGKQYMLPYYFSKTLMVYNKKLFAEANIDAPPSSFDELLDAAYKIKDTGEGRTGFITLNFDWLYWPLMAMNGIELLNEDMTEAAFNTPEMVDVVTRLAKATTDGAINPISWTGRWVEPNNAFAAGDIGMYQGHGAALFWIMGQADWANADTLGVVEWPGGWGVPNAHGLGISASTEHPDEAFDFIQIALNDKWQTIMADNFTILTLNNSVDEALIAGLDDPLKAATLELSLANMDKQTGNWVTPLDARIKDAFWPDIQAALLGQRDPAEAIADAENKVNRVLRRG
ncbi:MAG: sugar ABC transporter substrate-binding protein [Geminicoccaceae bacterium]|nr:sugar ABC transporter substrate-binding protein [Geminicoccaceae bacterium]HRY26765.1 sugar ABC transporter substrate-binding protein [Geminicoccaceae bacterium]